jgi:hypothetical protein
MKRFKIVETVTEYERYCEVYHRFLGFLWWRKWKGFRTASFNQALRAILRRDITWEERRVNNESVENQKSEEKTR